MHTLLYIFGWIIGGAVIVRKLRDTVRIERFSLIALCVAYVVLLGIFGHIYRQFYLSNHDNFVFAGDIAKTREKVTVANAERETFKLTKIVSALNQLEQELDAGTARLDTDTKGNNVFVNTKDYQWSFLFNTMWSGERNGHLLLMGRIIVSDHSDHEIAGEELLAKTLLAMLRLRTFPDRSRDEAPGA